VSRGRGDLSVALAELDTLAWSISEMAARSGELGSDDWLERSAAEGEARFREDLAAARADLEHPGWVGPFDGTRLRHTAVLAESDADRRQALTVADELDVAFAGAQLERALTEPIGSTAGLPKHYRAIDLAVAELEKRGRFTPELQQRAYAARERLATFRGQKKPDEAQVAEAGATPRKQRNSGRKRG
jgi:hypothetical protein